MDDAFKEVRMTIESFIAGGITRTELRDYLLDARPDAPVRSSVYVLWGATLKHLEIFELTIWSESELKASLAQLIESVESGASPGITDMVRDPRWWSGSTPIDPLAPSVRQDRHTARTLNWMDKEFEE